MICLPLGNNDIARSLHNRHAIRIEKLTVTFSNLQSKEAGYDTIGAD